MPDSARRLYLGIVFLGFSFAFSVAGFWLGYGWEFIDAVYMVVITIFSVGYTEVNPVVTWDMKLFTVFVIVSGCSALLYIVGAVIQMITEGQIDRAMNARRQLKDITALEDHVIICGYGRHGQILAREMARTHHDFVVVDASEERLELARDDHYLAYAGNATDEKVLEAVRIDSARTIATVLPDDAANVFITLSARTLNDKIQIIARGELPSTENKLLQAGANHVVLPASIGAERIVHLIARDEHTHSDAAQESDSILNAAISRLRVQIQDLNVVAGDQYIGKTLRETGVDKSEDIVAFGVRRNDGEVLLAPECSFHLEEGDTILLLERAKAAAKTATQ